MVVRVITLWGSNMKIRLLLVSLLALLLTACASSTGVVPVGQDRYMISVQGGALESGGKMLANVMKEANDYCAKQGKTAELLDSKTEDGQYGLILKQAKYATAQIQFTCK